MKKFNYDWDRICNNTIAPTNFIEENIWKAMRGIAYESCVHSLWPDTEDLHNEDIWYRSKTAAWSIIESMRI